MDTRQDFFDIFSTEQFLERKISVHLQLTNDSVAQLAEQLTLNQWVEGSNPSGVTFINKEENKVYKANSMLF